ncbi:MAG: proteasome accessory factor [Gaiellaceae bacterium]|jgi:proteasome accessory factor C|nr:proteasome accessory factor [Gaiellaceae bacterium]
MSHDTDKLIRQLSLVAFLMAERRAITARDVKSNVEGYSEMSDEAFARRFYSDRAELLSLGVPLQSQRDEFTGEELYTLRSEQYFLPKLELADEELAALQTAFYLLEGKFAYAEPLRLALQNLALGRPGFAEAPTETAGRVEVLDPDYSPETPGRLAKLENAISKQRTVKFEYWSISSDKTKERTLNPYALINDNGLWYVVGLDLDRKDIRTFRVSRIRGDIKFATRRERDFRAPTDFDVEQYRGRPPWQIGDIAGTARIEVRGDTAWWVRRAYGTTGTLEDDVFVTDYSSIPQLASWVLRQNGRAVPLEPHELKQAVGGALRRVREGHEGAPPQPAREKPVRSLDGVVERPAGPVAPERFAVLQSLLAFLLAACGEERTAEISVSDLIERFPSVPPDELEEHLSLLNLVNFGGGCYTVYAELRGSTVYVDKELWGDTFRAAPRLTPLEARAIRLALEYVGPMIAAEAHSPLARVRNKLEETFGQFELDRSPEALDADVEEDLVETLARGVRENRLVEIEYQKEADSAPSTRVVEPYSFGRELPNWYVHTWDQTSGGERSFRLDRMRSATLTDEHFEPRDGFEPTKLRNARTAQILYAKDVARFAAERGARRLTDGTALAERPYGDDEWLESEILAGRGDAVLVEPAELRTRIAARAKALAKELGVERLRAPA